MIIINENEQKSVPLYLYSAKIHTYSASDGLTLLQRRVEHI